VTGSAASGGALMLTGIQGSRRYLVSCIFTYFQIGKQSAASRIPCMRHQSLRLANAFINRVHHFAAVKNVGARYGINFNGFDAHQEKMKSLAFTPQMALTIARYSAE
jgi:hypothetical protein